MITGPDLDRHTLRFLGRTWHETDFYTYCVFCILQTIQRPEQSEEYDRLWKLRIRFDTLSDNYAKFYNPSENLAVAKVIVKYRGRVNFRQYIPKKRKCFSIKIYKLCDEAGYKCATGCTWVKTRNPPLMTWLQHMQLLEIWPPEMKA